MAVLATLLHSAQHTLRAGTDRWVVPGFAPEITSLRWYDLALRGPGAGAGNEECWGEN
ncbi:MAG: hypothetical protein P1U90_10265 [Akkermansiaceae bacterium]|nr:hypothetical protein [Akkermansiaceae bacterium]